MSRDRWTVTETDAGTRLDKWLANPERLGSRQRAFDAITRGRVFVDEVEQGRAEAGRRLEPGMVVRLWVDRPGSASRRGARKIHGLDILFEDDVIVVLDKPAGLLSVPLPDRPEEPSLASLLSKHWRSHGRREPLVVHRIDRDTTGAVVFAHSPDAWRDLKASFARREARREYLAVVAGHPEPDADTWHDALRWSKERRMQIPCARTAEGAREAEMSYAVEETFTRSSLVRFRLVTGRQHQVRVQAMAHGHPLLGERLYVGAVGLRLTEAFKRQALHAALLAFPHPVSKQQMTFEAPLPGDLRHLLQQLRSRAGGEKSS